MSSNGGRQRVGPAFVGGLCALAGAFTSVAAAEQAVRVYVTSAITDDIRGPLTVPDGGAPAAIRLFAAPGEYEPASFIVAAEGSSATLSFEATAFRGTQDAELPASALDLRYVKRWYQRQFGGYSPARPAIYTAELLVYDDALVKVERDTNFVRLENGDYVDMGQAGDERGFVAPAPDMFPVRDADALQPLKLKQGEMRQIWATFHVPVDAQPGVYLGDIVVSEGETENARVPVEITVLPIVLQRPLLEYSIYYRGKLNDRRSEGSISSEAKSEAQMLADFRNLREHGVTNPLVYQRLDNTLFPRVLRLRREAGLDETRLYYLGADIVTTPEGAVPPGLSDRVRRTRALADMSGFKEVYFYARDEARGEELAAQIPTWRQVQKDGGKVMAAGWQDGSKFPGNFSSTGGAEDLYVALGALREEEAARWHGKGKLIYSYQNPVGGFELPLTWRRNYGLLLWQAGYDGAMPYAWQHSYGHAWNDFDHYRHRDHNFTYPALNGPIDTVQWEGFREGVDDVRYLSTLLALIKSPRDASRKDVRAAKDWVEDLRSLPLGQSDLNEVRLEMVNHILRLSGHADSVIPAPAQPGRPADVEPDDSLVAWWRFDGKDETVDDVSGSGRNGELKGDVRRADSGFGSSIALGGDGGFAYFPNIEFAENGTGTIEGWFRFDSFAMDTITHMGLWSGFYQHSDNNQFYFLRTNEHFQVSGLVRKNVWHHIALTWDGDSLSATLYVDGNAVPVVVAGEVERVPEIDGFSLGRSIGYFGGLVGPSTNTFKGDIDEVRVWSRPLSADEVRASYLSRRGAAR